MGSKGRWFETHRRHYIVSVLCYVLVQPRNIGNRPAMTKNVDLDVANKLCYMQFCLFGLMLYVPVNSYGHVGTVSLPNHTVFLGKLALHGIIYCTSLTMSKRLCEPIDTQISLWIHGEITFLCICGTWQFVHVPRVRAEIFSSSELYNLAVLTMPIII